jgi:hypothetical protein
MTAERTHVLLHPYGTPDGFKQVLASNDQVRVRDVIAGYHRAGWQGKVYTVRARGFHDAVEKLGARLEREAEKRCR